MRGEVGKESPKKDMDNPLFFMTLHGWSFETLCKASVIPVRQATLWLPGLSLEVIMVMSWACKGSKPPPPPLLF